MRFRLVHHFGDGFDHGDLFLDTGEEQIPTYELSSSALNRLLSLIASLESGVALKIGLESAPHTSADFADSILRKQDHRRKYMEYSGPVSNNRGQVLTALEGELNFSFPAEQWPEKLWFWVQACEDSSKNHEKGNIP